MNDIFYDIKPEEFLRASPIDQKKQAMRLLSVKKEEKPRTVLNLPPIRNQIFNTEFKKFTESVISHEAGDISDAVILPQESIDLIEEITSIESDQNETIEIKESESIIDEVLDRTVTEKKNPEAIVSPELNEEIKEEMDELPFFLEKKFKTTYPASSEILESNSSKIKGIEEKQEIQSPRLPEFNEEIVSIENEFKVHKPPFDSFFMNFLLRMTAKKKLNEDDFSDFFKIIHKFTNSSASAIIAYDNLYSSYRVLTQKGIDKFTMQNLYFGKEDVYLNREDRWELLKFNNHIKSDFNFKKRFSTDFITRYNGALFFNLHIYNYPGFLICFYKNIENVNSRLVYSKMEPYLEEILPLIERFRMETWPKRKYEDTNLTESIFQVIHQMSPYGTDQVEIINLKFFNPSDESNFQALQSTGYEWLLSTLNMEDRMLVTGPGRLILFSRKKNADVILENAESLSEKWGVQLQSSISTYPDNGTNILNYINTGSKVVINEFSSQS